MQTSDTLNEFAAAMAAAQSQMGPAIKGAKNPHFRSSYADLSSVVEAVREPLTANGLCFVQSPRLDGEFVTVTTRIIHTSGQWIEAAVSARPGRGNNTDLSPQAVGSAITYLKRYGLQALCGLPSADDDGEAAMGRNGRSSAPQRPAKPKAPAKPKKWSDKERAAFCAKLRDIGLNYGEVAEFCEAKGRPRPSAMDNERRQHLLEYLEGAADVVKAMQEAEA